MQEEKSTSCNDKKKTVEPKKEVKTTNNNSKVGEFKRKYFEFYDDIKISDRQDW